MFLLLLSSNSCLLLVSRLHIMYSSHLVLSAWTKLEGDRTLGSILCTQTHIRIVELENAYIKLQRLIQKTGIKIQNFNYFT